MKGIVQHSICALDFKHYIARNIQSCTVSGHRCDQFMQLPRDIFNSFKGIKKTPKKSSEKSFGNTKKAQGVKAIGTIDCFTSNERLDIDKHSFFLAL